MTDFRMFCPQRRSNPRKVSHYRMYKKDLRTDFRKCCGYCGDEDSWSGGYRFFQIDHFVPRDKMTSLSEKDYSNLVYSCFYCNNKKRADWPTGDESIHNNGIEGYIDPCDPTYGKQFQRDEIGEIIPVTPLGTYMHFHLNLSLRRHALIWNLCQLYDRIEKLRELKNCGKLDEDSSEFTELLIKFFELDRDLRDENCKDSEGNKCWIKSKTDLTTHRNC